MISKCTFGTLIYIHGVIGMKNLKKILSKYEEHSSARLYMLHYSPLVFILYLLITSIHKIFVAFALQDINSIVRTESKNASASESKNCCSLYECLRSKAALSARPSGVDIIDIFLR